MSGRPLSRQDPRGMGNLFITLIQEYKQKYESDVDIFVEQDDSLELNISPTSSVKANLSVPILYTMANSYYLKHGVSHSHYPAVDFFQPGYNGTDVSQGDLIETVSLENSLNDILDIDIDPFDGSFWVIEFDSVPIVYHYDRSLNLLDSWEPANGDTITVDRVNGTIWTMERSDLSNNSLRRHTRDGEEISATGSDIPTPPYGITHDWVNDVLLTGGFNNDAIRAQTKEGDSSSLAIDGQPVDPQAPTIDPLDGNVWYRNQNDGTDINKVDRYTESVIDGFTASNSLDWLAVDPIDGSLWGIANEQDFYHYATRSGHGVVLGNYAFVVPDLNIPFSYHDRIIRAEYDVGTGFGEWTGVSDSRPSIVEIKAHVGAGTSLGEGSTIDVQIDDRGDESEEEVITICTVPQQPDSDIIVPDTGCIFLRAGDKYNIRNTDDSISENGIDEVNHYIL